MATRTSSPPGSRSRSTSVRSTPGPPGARSRTAAAPGCHEEGAEVPAEEARLHREAAPGPARGAQRARPGRALLRHDLPRCRRGLARGRPRASAGWPAGIGRSARDLEPEHRRDGVGLLILAVALVTAAAVWFQLGGDVMGAVRVAVTGTVGKVGWLVPLALVVVAWRNLRDPVHNGPAGRQVVGWLALALGVLGVVHIANGSPQPVAGDAGPLREGGGAIGYVVSVAAARPAALARGRRAGPGAARVLRGARHHRHPALPRARAARPRCATARSAGTPAEDEADESDLPTRPIRARGRGRGRRRLRSGRLRQRPGVRQPGARGPRGQEASAPRCRRRRRPPPTRSSRSVARRADDDHQGGARAASAHADPAAGRAAGPVRRHRLQPARATRCSRRARRTRRGPSSATTSSTG